MKAEDFAAWLAAISGMSSAQRAEAFATLEKAGAGGADAVAESSGRAPGKRGRREDALGTTSLERVEAQGCPHCAGREIVGWGRSHGLLRFRCKSCGRTFNALTKTPMAHLRKKEKWPAHARAMIEGKSLAKTAQLCGVHPTTAFRWRHRFLRAPAANKPRTLRGIVEADETFILESFKGRWSDRAQRVNGAARPGIRGPIRTISPSSSLALHLAGMAKDEEPIPEPSSLEAVMADRENRDAVAILVKAPPATAKAVRVNMTLPEDELEQIDKFAAEHGYTRSGFLLHAAKKDIDAAEATKAKAG